MDSIDNTINLAKDTIDNSIDLTHNTINEIKSTTKDGFNGLFLFFLLISSNFIGELFGCRLQKALTENMFVKHGLGMFTLFASVITTLADNYSVQKSILMTIGLYIWFVLISRCQNRYVVVIIFLLLVNYSLDKLVINKKNKDENNENNLLSKSKDIIYILVLILTIVGFITYFYNKKTEYGKTFTLYKFLIGTPNCKSLN